MNTPYSLPMPTAVGSIDSYISLVRRYALLTQKEEFDLATRFRNDNDLDAAKKLVISHLRVVVSVARGYAGYGLAQADLVQEGNIGLMKAVKNYDPNVGVRLVSYALHWIRAEINEFVVRNWRMVKIATTKSQRKLFFNLRRLRQNLGSLKPQQITDIADKLNVSEADVVEMEARFAGHEFGLESTNHDDDDENYAHINHLADSIDREPSTILETTENVKLRNRGLQKALSNLDDRSRRIVESRWLHEDSSATLHELAAEFNVSAERIRQIEQKAMSKMQTALSTL
ncbi:MAG: RNA polymerase sigma factor RpoH [Gallionella sp.]